MADPFSIVAGALSVAEICAHLVIFLKQAADNFSATDQNLLGLIEEIESLQRTNTAIRNLIDPELFATGSEKGNHVFLHTKTTLAKCEISVRELREVLLEIVSVGNEHKRIVHFRKWQKSHAKEEYLSALRKKIHMQQETLARCIPLIQQ